MVPRNAGCGICIPTTEGSTLTAADVTEQLEAHDAYGNTLELGDTAKGNLEKLMLVFTPLLTSLLTSALGSG